MNESHVFKYLNITSTNRETYHLQSNVQFGGEMVLADALKRKPSHFIRNKIPNITNNSKNMFYN